MDEELSSPLLGVIVGATLTYLMGVRTRRREKIDELFDEAIAKVAIKQASRIHPTKLGISDFSSDDLKRLEDDFRGPSLLMLENVPPNADAPRLARRAEH